ncbi:MAG: hypothetical protein ACRDH0_09795 [Actinomycetota bacterium]
MADEHELTRAFQEAARRRADLHHALVDVERAISSPAAGRLEAWTGDVVKRLTILREAIDEHIEVTERQDGLYDEILHRAPRLSGQVERLRIEHPSLRDGTIRLIEQFHAIPIGDGWSLDDARDDVQRLLGKVVKHRQAGADLVWEAYNLDIGGIE